MLLLVFPYSSIFLFPYLFFFFHFCIFSQTFSIFLSVCCRAFWFRLLYIRVLCTRVVLSVWISIHLIKNRYSHLFCLFVVLYFVWKWNEHSSSYCYCVSIGRFLFTGKACSWRIKWLKRYCFVHIFGLSSIPSFKTLLIQCGSVWCIAWNTIKTRN